MAENKQLQEFDFYREALKAFDLPQLPEEPLAEAPIALDEPQIMEETSPEEMQVEEAPRNQWWLIAVTAVLCMTLLICFWPKASDTEYRGESWLYGDVMDRGKNYMILLDSSGESWYVDISGLEVPAWATDQYLLLKSYWVFYDGQPKNINRNGCTKKVKATTVVSSSGALVEDLEQYGLIVDQVLFDLDGDSKPERWLLCESPTVGIPSQRLVALDDAGRAKYDVVIYSTISGNSIFHPQEGKLQLIGLGAVSRMTLDIRLEQGKVAVYNGKRVVQSVDLMIPVSPLPVVTEPPVETVEICVVQFGFITSLDPAYNGANNVCTSFLQITEEEMTQLYYGLLENRVWKTLYDGEIIQAAGWFTLQMGEENTVYTFTNNRTVIRGDQYTQLGAQEWNTLIELMQRCGRPFQAVSGEYEGTDAAGRNIMIDLKSDGTFRLSFDTHDVHISGATDMITFGVIIGKYALIDDYLIMMDTTMALSDSLSVNNSRVFVFQNRDEGLYYSADLSEQTTLDIPNGQLFQDPARISTAKPYSLIFQFSPITPPGGEEIAAYSGEYVLNSTQKQMLQAIFSGLEWTKMDQSVWPLGTLRVYADDGSNKLYSILSGKMLYSEEGFAVLKQAEWDYLMGILYQLGTGEQEKTAYTAVHDGRKFVLALGENNCFALTEERESGGKLARGTYIRIGQLLYFCDTNNNSFLMVAMADGILEYQATGSGLEFWNISDGLCFESAPFTEIDPE